MQVPYAYYIKIAIYVYYICIYYIIIIVKCMHNMYIFFFKLRICDSVPIGPTALKCGSKPFLSLY